MFRKFNLLLVILAVLIIFIPLYPKFPLASVTGTYVAIRLDDIVVAISIFIWLIYQLKHRLPILREPITKLLLAYYLAIVASFISAIFIYQTDPPQILLLHLLRRFEYSSLFFITLSALKKYTDLKAIYIIGYLTTFAVIVYGYGQKYFHFPIVSTMNSEFSKGQLLQMDVWSRISSTFAGHYDLAAYLSVILVIIGGAFFLSANIKQKLIHLFLWLLAFNLLTLTASRVSTFAFYGGMCLTIVMLRKYFWIIPVTLIFTFSLLNSKDLNQRLLATIPTINIPWFINNNVVPTPTTSTISMVTPTKPPIAIGPFTTPIPTIFRHPSEFEEVPIDVDVGVARSGEIRFNAEWPRAITAFNKNLLLGTGLGSITLATDNDYLRLLGESGLLGFITFMAIPLFFVFKTLKKPTKITLIFLGAMITFLVNASLIDVFEASKTAYLFWIMMGLYYVSFK
jgi:hypothetical protein